eukprot:CAMPEP_0172761422 /NCGR_PEP_ID=MMETSP1074-20121228/171510_1 /TAXON_ID=2916 /ORGANISM="Ceratium fusus, Strain PA161109" /LENGTH=580 /DNA_ID=CAMNT_0013595605 /DNA_START=140 /DNA_END=1878 /DNA_ORIENTATION=+
MKNELRESMAKPPYDVCNFYKKSGLCQKIARHPKFELVTNVVVSINALWIAVDTDKNRASTLLDAELIFQILENTFCIYFVLEWLVRFFAFRQKKDCLRDFWFVFDSGLLAAMCSETWFMTLLMLIVGGGSGNSADGVGNLSILRIASALQADPHGSDGAPPACSAGAAHPRQGPEDRDAVRAVHPRAAAAGHLPLRSGIHADLPRHAIEKVFKTVPQSMHLLLVNAALLDGLDELMRPLKEQSILLLFLFYAFLFLAALTLMSMLIGVVCEVVGAVATMEKETITVNYTRDKLQELLKLGVDVNHDQRISKDEFLRMFTIPEAVDILHEIDVDVIGLLDFTETIFEPDILDLENGAAEERTLDFSEFMHVVLGLRGQNPATVRDVVETRKSVNNRIRLIDKRLNTILPAPTSESREKFGIDVDSKLAQQLHGLVTKSVFEIVKTIQNEHAAQHAENSKAVSALTEENKQLRQALGEHKMSLPTIEGKPLNAGSWQPALACNILEITPAKEGERVTEALELEVDRYVTQPKKGMVAAAEDETDEDIESDEEISEDEELVEIVEADGKRNLVLHNNGADSA